MEVYLIRHTTPQIEKGICYGQSNIPLTESFHSETHKLKTHLPELFDVVYSSPMSRCTKLAQFIHAKELFIPDKRLLEMNFGDWEMKKWDDLNQEVLNEWMKDFVSVRVPNGENFIDLNKRVNEFIDELIQTNYKKIAIATHAGVIRCFVARVLEIPLNNAFKIPVDYSGITKIQLNVENCFSKVEYLNRIAK
jgi:alpha-ribazole phosphatase